MWLACVTFGCAPARPARWTSGRSPSGPLIIGIGMPLFFLPLNMVGLGSVDPEETASAAGLLNFIRTMSGAFATSPGQHGLGEHATRNQAELAGPLQRCRGHDRG